MKFESSMIIGLSVFDNNQLNFELNEIKFLQCF